MKRSTCLALSCLLALALAACGGSDQNQAPSPGEITFSCDGLSASLTRGVTEIAPAPFCSMSTNTAGVPDRFYGYAFQAEIGSNAFANLVGTKPGIVPASAFAQMEVETNLVPFGPGTFTVAFFQYRAVVGTNIVFVWERGAGQATITDSGQVGGYVRGTFTLTNAVVTVVSNTNSPVFTDLPGKTITGVFRFQRITDNHPLFVW